MTINNLIKFPISEEFYFYWKPTQIAHLLQDNYLNIIVRRKDYTQVTEGKGVKGEKGYLQTFGDKEYIKNWFSS